MGYTHKFGKGGAFASGSVMDFGSFFVSKVFMKKERQNQGHFLFSFAFFAGKIPEVHLQRGYHAKQFSAQHSCTMIMKCCLCIIRTKCRYYVLRSVIYPAVTWFL